MGLYLLRTTSTKPLLRLLAKHLNEQDEFIRRADKEYYPSNQIVSSLANVRWWNVFALKNVLEELVSTKS